MLDLETMNKKPKRNRYTWTFDKTKSNKDIDMLNNILCQQEDLESPNEFDQLWFTYSYYAFEGDFETYYINLGLFIDNFDIYKNAKAILELYHNSITNINEINIGRQAELDIYYANKAAFQTDENGWVRVTSELAAKYFNRTEPIDFTYSFDPEHYLLKPQKLLTFLINDYCPGNEILGGDLITSGHLEW